MPKKKGKKRRTSLWQPAGVPYDLSVPLLLPIVARFFSVRSSVPTGIVCSKATAPALRPIALASVKVEKIDENGENHRREMNLSLADLLMAKCALAG